MPSLRRAARRGAQGRQRARLWRGQAAAQPQDSDVDRPGAGGRDTQQRGRGQVWQGRKREGNAGHSPARRSCSSPWRPRVSAPWVPARHPLSAIPPPRAYGGRHGGSGGDRGARSDERGCSRSAAAAPPHSPPHSGRSGAGGAWGRGQCTAARGVPARHRRFRCGGGGGGGGAEPLRRGRPSSELRARPSLAPRCGSGLWEPGSVRRGCPRV